MKILDNKLNELNNQRIINIYKAINSIMLFSTNVTVVIGKFIAVPKQAHCIRSLFINERSTPIVVEPRIINVANKDIYSSNRIKNATPKRVSRNG